MLESGKNMDRIVALSKGAENKATDPYQITEGAYLVDLRSANYLEGKPSSEDHTILVVSLDTQVAGYCFTESSAYLPVVLDDFIWMVYLSAKKPYAT